MSRKHGNMSRAGKVRKATPKVENCNKKSKSSSGRARMKKKFSNQKNGIQGNKNKAI